MRRFKQVDVFTERAFLGNPLAVVIDAEGLDAAAMQRIARWTNLSETTFLLEEKSYSARQRMQLGREGRIAMRVSESEIWLGGEAVTCVEGMLKA